MSRVFPLGDVLTVLTGKLLAEDMGAVYRVLNCMTRDNLFTHQIPRAMRACEPWLARQFPEMAAIDASGITPDNWRSWLREQEERFGMMIAVEPLPGDDWQHIDPVTEAEAISGRPPVVISPSEHRCAKMPDNPGSLKFGKLPAKIDVRTLAFANYLTPALPPPPASFSVLPRVQTAVPGLSTGRLFPMDGNSTHGDCTIAAAAHSVTIYNALCKARRIPSAARVLSEYFAMSGGQDNGLVSLDVMNKWRQTGFFHNSRKPLETIEAFAYISPRRHIQVQQAISIFGCVYVGFRTTTETLSQFRAHQPWTPGDPDGNGHAVVAVAYDPVGLTLLTWGGVQRGLWAWLDAQADEVYAVLPTEGKTAGYAPGFDFATLQQDLQAVTG